MSNKVVGNVVEDVGNELSPEELKEKMNQVAEIRKARANAYDFFADQGINIVDFDTVYGLVVEEINRDYNVIGIVFDLESLPFKNPKDAPGKRIHHPTVDGVFFEITDVDIVSKELTGYEINTLEEVKDFFGLDDKYFCLQFLEDAVRTKLVAICPEPIIITVARNGMVVPIKFEDDIPY